MRRPVTMRWHKYVYMALRYAVSKSWLTMTEPSTNLSALTESIIADWLRTHTGFDPNWLITGNSGAIPEATWQAWKVEDACREAKETGKWVRIATERYHTDVSPSQPQNSPPKAPGAIPGRPQRIPANAQRDTTDHRWSWQDTRGHWHAYSDGMTISGTEPSWIWAERAKAERTDREQRRSSHAGTRRAKSTACQEASRVSSQEWERLVIFVFLCQAVARGRS